MAGFEMNTNEHLNRESLYSDTLKTLLDDELMAMRYVRILDLPSDIGSSTFNIPSVGRAEINDFVEGQRVKYNKFDTGNYTFTIDKYKYSALSMSEKFKRDSHWAPQVLAKFTPEMHRAIMVDIETRILAVANSGQTASNQNQINGTDHRWVGQGTNSIISVKDFAKAQHSLKKANVPMNNLIAIVDPSVIYALQTQANVVNLLSPQYSSIVSNKTETGMRFAGMNVYGFDVYSSNYLPGDITETVNGSTVTTYGVVNYLFNGSGGDISPWVGAFTQKPTVHTEFNKDTQETEYVTFVEYGFQGDYRPENLIVVLTDSSQIN